MNPSRWFRRVSPGTFRRGMRLFPPIRNSGIRVESISDDWRTWTFRLPLNRRTRNYVGTHYGGTLYSAADPHYMLAWMHILGDGFVVWDKAASVRFRKPGRGTLRASFTIDAAEIEEIRAMRPGEKQDRHYTFEWTDTDGDIVASIEKTIYFHRPNA